MCLASLQPGSYRALGWMLQYWRPGYVISRVSHWGVFSGVCYAKYGNVFSRSLYEILSSNLNVLYVFLFVCNCNHFTVVNLNLLVPCRTGLEAEWPHLGRATMLLIWEPWWWQAWVRYRFSVFSEWIVKSVTMSVRASCKPLVFNHVQLGCKWLHIHSSLMLHQLIS